MRVLVQLLVLVGVMCACGRTSDRIAELVVATGTVERQQAVSKPWAPAKVGDGFVLGSALRTADAAHATLTVGAARLEVNGGSTVRFSREPGRPLKLDVETGTAQLEVTGSPMEIETSLGRLKLAVGSSARLGGDTLEILLGEAEIARGGQKLSLKAGDEIAIDLGDAEMLAVRKTGKKDDVIKGAVIEAHVKGGNADVNTAAGWTPLPEGTSPVEAGARIRVGTGTSVDVVRGEERATVTGAAEVVAGGADGSLVTAIRGKVTTEAKTRDVSIAVPGGAIVARASSAADVSVDDKDAANVAVRRGQVDVVTKNGTDSLHVGESVAVASDGTVTDIDRAPANADIKVVAGRSAVVHDGTPPTAVRVEVGAVCSGDALVEVPRDRKPVLLSVGKGGANVRLPAGTHRYRVYCMTGGEREDKVRFAGSVTILKDAGRMTLPRRPPANMVDADGRPYLVVYQNLLPDLTFRWAGALPSTSYKLYVESAKGGAVKIEQTMTKPSHSCLSGQLAEGEYKYWFETVSGAKSPTGKLTIEFDNAAATASIRSVAKTAEGALHVEGSVLPGWKIAAGGKSVPTDAAGRFTVDAAPEVGGAVAILLEHPERGSHFYVVRAPEK